MGQHGAKAVGLIVALAASTLVACAPALGQPAQSAPPQTAQTVAEPLVVDDVIGRTLESEGLLGALARIDAELGPTLPTGNVRLVDVTVSVESDHAKLPPAPSFADEVIVTWGAAADDLGELPDVQR